MNFSQPPKHISIAKSKVIAFVFYGMHGTSDKYKQIKGLIINKWTEIGSGLKGGSELSIGISWNLIIFLLFLTIYSNKTFCIKRKSLQKTIYKKFLWFFCIIYEEDRKAHSKSFVNPF